MFNSLEKAVELVNKLRQSKYEELCCMGITVTGDELLALCEDFITAQQCCDTYSQEFESLKNYIRLLEKENKELKGQN